MDLSQSARRCQRPKSEASVLENMINSRFQTSVMRDVMADIIMKSHVAFSLAAEAFEMYWLPTMCILIWITREAMLALHFLLRKE